MTHQAKQKSILQKCTLDCMRDLISLFTATLPLYSVLKVWNDGNLALLTRFSSAAPVPCWRSRLCWSFHCTGSSWWTLATPPQTWMENHLSHWCWEAEWKLWQRQNTNTFSKPHSETFFCLCFVVNVGWERHTSRGKPVCSVQESDKEMKLSDFPSCTHTVW